MTTEQSSVHEEKPGSMAARPGFRDTAAENMQGPFRIVRDIERPDPSVIAELKAAGADYPVAFAGHLGLGRELMLTPSIRPMKLGARLMGPAFTVKAHDNLMPMYAMQLAKPGDILVIDAGGWSSVSVFGGSMLHSAHMRRLGGIVINGMVCDSAMLAPQMNDPRYSTPMFALGATGAYSGWEKPGSINVAVYIDGHRIDPGDLVVGASDGVAVIPKHQIHEAVEISKTFQARIPDWHQPMNEEGKTFFEVLKLESVIRELGIPENDR